MTALAPEKNTGERCGEMLSQGMVSYRCELKLGHYTVPESDPEPHYAVEVGRSVRAWQAWKQRQMERAANPSVTILGGVTCPTCGKAMRESNAHGLSAVCVDPTCSQAPIDIAQSASREWPFKPEFDETTDAVVAGTYSDEEMQAKAYLRQVPGKDAAWEDVTDLGRINTVMGTENYACPRTVPHDHHFWGLKGSPEVYQCKGDLTDPPAVAKDDPAFAAEPETPDDGLREFVSTHQPEPARSDYDEVEPTKQREGDQPLPDGGYACVQDAVIEAMEESKAVGLQRYGSTLMTFNGRKGIQDVHEEVRDLFVYLTQIKMEAEVTREQLEIVVANRIRPLLAAVGTHSEITAESIAVIAVDAVMGWVVGQPSQEPPSQPTG